jgi:hypothetical protein
VVVGSLYENQALPIGRRRAARNWLRLDTLAPAGNGVLADAGRPVHQVAAHQAVSNHNFIWTVASAIGMQSRVAMRNQYE